MARDNPVRDRDDTINSDEAHTDDGGVLDRRSYLKWTGTTAAALGLVGAGSASASTNNDVIRIDYDDYRRPGDVYHVNDVRGYHTPEFVTNRATKGTTSLYKQFSGSQKTANVEYRFPDHVGSHQTEVYTRFNIYPENFSLGANDTVRIFWAPLTNGGGSSGGGATDGTNGWSNAIGFANRNNSPAPDGYHFFSYSYHLDNSGSGDFEMTRVPVWMDEWNEIECYIRCNTYSGGSANADGVMRYWVNGELAYERTNFRFTTTSDNRIEGVGPLGYIVGSGAGGLYYDEHDICLGMTREEARAALRADDDTGDGNEDTTDDTDDGNDDDTDDAPSEEPVAGPDVELAVSLEDVDAGTPVAAEVTFTSDDAEIYEGTMTVSVGEQTLETDWLVGSEHIYSPQYKGADFEFNLDAGTHDWEVVADLDGHDETLTESGTVQVVDPDVELAVSLEDVDAGTPVAAEVTFTSDDAEIYEGTMTVSVGDQTLETDWIVGSEHIYSPQYKGADFEFDLNAGTHDWEVVADLDGYDETLTESGTVQVEGHDVELAVSLEDVDAGTPVAAEVTFTSDDAEIYEGTMTVSVGDQTLETDWFVGSEHIYSPQYKGVDFEFDLDTGTHDWEVVADLDGHGGTLTESGTVQVGEPSNFARSRRMRQ